MTAVDNHGYDTDGSRGRGRQGKGAGAGTGTDDEGGNDVNPTPSTFDPTNRTIRFPDETHALNNDSSQGNLRGRAAVARDGGEE